MYSYVSQIKFSTMGGKLKWMPDLLYKSYQQNCKHRNEKLKSVYNVTFAWRGQLWQIDSWYYTLCRYTFTRLFDYYTMSENRIYFNVFVGKYIFRAASRNSDSGNVIHLSLTLYNSIFEVLVLWFSDLSSSRTSIMQFDLCYRVKTWHLMNYLNDADKSCWPMQPL